MEIPILDQVGNLINELEVIFKQGLASIEKIDKLDHLQNELQGVTGLESKRLRILSYRINNLAVLYSKKYNSKNDPEMILPRLRLISSNFISFLPLQSSNVLDYLIKSDFYYRTGKCFTNYCNYELANSCFKTALDSLSSISIEFLETLPSFNDQLHHGKQPNKEQISKYIKKKEKLEFKILLVYSYCCYRNQNIDLAIFFLNHIRDQLIPKIQNVDKYEQLGLRYYNLAFCLFNDGKHEKIINLLDQSLNSFLQGKEKDASIISQILRFLALVYLKKKKFSNSLSAIRKANTYLKTPNGLLILLKILTKQNNPKIIHNNEFENQEKEKAIELEINKKKDKYQKNEEEEEEEEEEEIIFIIEDEEEVKDKNNDEVQNKMNIENHSIKINNKKKNKDKKKKNKDENINIKKEDGKDLFDIFHELLSFKNLKLEFYFECLEIVSKNKYCYELLEKCILALLKKYSNNNNDDNNLLNRDENSKLINLKWIELLIVIQKTKKKRNEKNPNFNKIEIKIEELAKQISREHNTSKNVLNKKMLNHYCDLLWNKATFEYQNKNYEKSIDYFQFCYQMLDTEEIESKSKCLRLISRSYLELKDFVQSRKFSYMAAEIDPNSIYTLFLQFITNLNSNLIVEATDSLEKFLHSSNFDPNFLSYCAKICCKLNKKKIAVRALTILIEHYNLNIEDIPIGEISLILKTMIQIILENENSAINDEDDNKNMIVNNNEDDFGGGGKNHNSKIHGEFQNNDHKQNEVKIMVEENKKNYQEHFENFSQISNAFQIGYQLISKIGKNNFFSKGNSINDQIEFLAKGIYNIAIISSKKYQWLEAGQLFECSYNYLLFLKNETYLNNDFLKLQIESITSSSFCFLEFEKLNNENNEKILKKIANLIEIAKVLCQNIKSTNHVFLNNSLIRELLLQLEYETETNLKNYDKVKNILINEFNQFNKNKTDNDSDNDNGNSNNKKNNDSNHDSDKNYNKNYNLKLFESFAIISLKNKDFGNAQFCLQNLLAIYTRKNPNLLKIAMTLRELISISKNSKQRYNYFHQFYLLFKDFSIKTPEILLEIQYFFSKCWNVGVSFFRMKKNDDAEQWMSLALKIASSSEENKSYIQIMNSQYSIVLKSKKENSLY
ncbi:sporulation-specific protein [Anaeramoeba flamelloides]|uniref:Protein ZIP4 homolog n=1 Tax=Anaeramoeba flamelloides TaxID=1746091 RepID=A0ABQ8XF57_9EUKA|nr:sporulation-specific protein [Anaeramoeba flamelloides]